MSRNAGPITILFASFSRPADTTQYAANDLVGVTTSVAPGNAIEIIGAVDLNGEGFRIEVARLRKTDKSLTSATFRLHFFSELPTWTVGDNGAGGAITALAVADLAGHVGYVDITMDRASATAGAYGVGNPGPGAITIRPAEGTSFWVSVQATGTYTPASGETFTIALEGARK